MTHPVHTQALRAQCRIDTPLGPMRLAASAHGLAGAWFEDQRHHPGPLAAPDDGEHPWLRAAAAALAAYWRGEWPECVDPVSDQVGDGIANEAGKAMAREIGNEVGHRFGPKADGRPRRERVGREPLDAASRAVSLDLAGTAFQQTVWKALRCIPPGATLDYASLAAQLGRPGAARAVGAAVGRNPVSLLLPCHRVVGRDGRLTGYAGGLARKQALLAHEAHEAQETHASAGVNRAMKASAARQAGATPSLPLADAPQRMDESRLMAAPAARQAVR